ncbi:MAG: AAA family ATPase [Candidatus Methanospirareceae archaeon]
MPEDSPGGGGDGGSGDSGFFDENFKSIRNLEIELAPLTIFVGPNSSGKSNVLESIAILAQTPKLPPDIVRSLPGSLGYGDAFMPKNREVCQAVFVNGKKLIEVGYGHFKEEDSAKKQELLYPEELKEFLFPSGNIEYILDSTCFRYNLKPSVTEEQKKEIEELYSKAQEIVRRIESAVRDIYFISAIRGEVRPAVEIDIGEPRLGTHGEGLIEILSLIFRRWEEKAEKIMKWASKFGLEEIKAGWWGKRYLSADYIDPELQTRLNMAVESHGSRQILTIITQVIVTTHSEHLILALKPLIINEELKPEDVAIWHFEKTKEGTKAEKLNITDKGIVEGWIPSYVKAEGEIIKEWFDTLPED